MNFDRRGRLHLFLGRSTRRVRARRFGYRRRRYSRSRSWRSADVVVHIHLVRSKHDDLSLLRWAPLSLYVLGFLSTVLALPGGIRHRHDQMLEVARRRSPSAARAASRLRFRHNCLFVHRRRQRRQIPQRTRRVIERELPREGQSRAQAPASGKRHIRGWRAVPRLLPGLAVTLLGLPVDGAEGPLEWATHVRIGWGA